MERARLAALIEAARQAQLDLSPDEWREVVYLASVVGPAAAPQPPVPTGTHAPAARGTHPAPDHPPPPDADPQPAPTGAHGAPGDAVMVPYSSGPHAPQGLPVRAPMTQTLVRNAFARAFRPVKRTVPDRAAVEVDVPETVRRAAESDAWLPSLVAAPDRWLNLSVVVDDAASGPAWVQEVRSLVQSVEESGAFGDIRLWRFDSDSPAGTPLTVSGGTTAAQVGRNARELIDPTGRHAILVLSDCVGAGWADGRVGVMLSTWTPLNAVAILNLLPQRLWRRCATPFVPVEWATGAPFAARQPQRWRPAGTDPLTGRQPDDDSLGRQLVPVLDFSASALNGWAHMLAGGIGRHLKGVAFDPAARGYGPFVDDFEDADPVDPADAARQQVKRFRASASPGAYRLATLLSAAVLQLPVVHLVQRTMSGSARTTHWAEILLSGLVVRLPGTEPSFDFQPGVREELLTELTRRESLGVLSAVSEFVMTRLGGSFDFLALMTMGSNSEPLSESERPLAHVAIQVLRLLGGTYADKADSISRLFPDNDLASDITNQNSTGTASARDGDLDVTTSDIPAAARSLARFAISSAEQILDVPQRTPYFIGRDDLLDRLRQDLIENPNRAAILVPRAMVGLGGVGKTALANEYAHLNRNDYEIVWWIPAEDPADIRRSLVDLSRRLRLPESTDQSETIRTLLAALSSGNPKSRWLLIYDNAAGPETITDLLPKPKRHGHVLITSREPAWEAKGQLLEVDVFTRDESMMLLQRRAATLTRDEADALSALLEDLPLALHQAAAWHAETRLPAAEYRRRYDEKLALLAEVELPREYPRPVGATFGVSYDQLQQRSKAAAQLIQLCSHFGPEPIFVDMLYNARNVNGLPTPLNRQMADRSTISRELRELARYELVKFDQARERFQLHRLVQTVLRRTLSPEQRQTTPEQAHSILALANPGNPDELGPLGRARHGQLSPHIRPSGIVESTDREARRVVLDQIRYRYVVGDFAGSRDLAESTLQRWQSQWGARDELVLLARRHLAQTLRSLGELNQAQKIDREVLQLFHETLGEDSDHYLVTANGYGADLRALGRFREALEFDKELLAQHHRVLRPDDPATLRTANNYAVDLRLMGEFGEARDLDTESVRLWTENYGADFPDTLFAISNLVRDYYGLGHYGEGLIMQEEAITVHEAVVGSSHLNVLMARRTVAMLMRKLGRYTKAREGAETNYSAYSAQFPENHEHTLAAAMSLGNALRDEHSQNPIELNRAREIFENALRIYERDFIGHPFVEVCRINLAIVLRRLGQVAQARELNVTARTRLTAALSVHHPYALCATTNLASDLAALGEYEEASVYSQEVLEFSRQEAIRGPAHPYTLACMLNHALDLEGAGRGHEAEVLRRTAVEGFVRTLGADHPDSQAARNRQRIDADIEPPPT
ncbi:FxSxx-COOH system tetratricopeptide repeat protein [Actinoplanes sp. NPDC051513]|uniref:FxSxx-COOH system tetratricopeptide repeat protein n=1 Tax=Actinoplanes sp. NPDC051513 TaxID=3363908 RepID=UPI003795F144